MKRGVFLDAIDEGKKVRGKYTDGEWCSFWRRKDGCWDGDKSVWCSSIEETFLECTDYEIVPEPDTAEEILRDWVSWENNLEESNHTIYNDILTRARALIAQMDGEK